MKIIPLQCHPGTAAPHSHPGRLIASARLFTDWYGDLDVSSCRVLELGSGYGENLLPLALSLPNATFVGLETRRKNCETSRMLAGQVGVDNVSIYPGNDWRDAENEEAFDVVIVRQPYSSVTVLEQERLLADCHRFLKPRGLAYIKFDCLPGARHRQTIRDALQKASFTADAVVLDPKAAIDHLEFLGRHTLSSSSSISAKQTIIDFVSRCKRGVITRNEWESLLSKHYQPTLLVDFCRLLDKQGLRYRLDADVEASLHLDLPDDARDTLAQLNDDPVRQQQYADFLQNRHARHAIVSRQGQHASSATLTQRLMGLHFRGGVLEVARENTSEFGSSVDFESLQGRRFRCEDPLMIFCLRLIGQAYPNSISFEHMCAEATRVLLEKDDQNMTSADPFMNTITTSVSQLIGQGLIQGSLTETSCFSEVSTTPEGYAWARIQAAYGSMVTNVHHENLSLENLERELLRQLNGRKTRPQLEDWLRDYFSHHDLVAVSNGQCLSDNSKVETQLERWLYNTLKRFGQQGLLVG